MAHRSLILNMEVTTVGRAHNCRYNKKHRLEKDHHRLTVRSDGDEHHYCLECAKTFLIKDVERLRKLLSEIERLTS